MSKGGKPYARVLLKFDEYKDGKGNNPWISGFGNKRTWEWKAGEDVSPIITENGQYFNFTFDDTPENRLNLYELPCTIGFVMSLFEKFGSKTTKVKKENPEPPQSDGGIEPSQIPF